MKHIYKQQSGFTLIELVMVIVILGILAATALPKFVDLRGDAYDSVANGFGGALSSAAAINYAGCAAKNFPAAGVANVCIRVQKCSDIFPAMAPNPGVTLTAPPAASVAKTIYLTTDTAAATIGLSVTCSAHYGTGATAVPFAYTVTGT